MRVVLDTNVLVSGLLSPKGPPAQILDLWHQEKFELVVSAAILGEYLEVLASDKIKTHIKLRHEEIREIVDNFRRYAVLVDPKETAPVVADDPDDDKFLACGLAAGAEYIVSGDEHLLGLISYQGMQILSPRAFLIVLTGEK